MSLHDSISPSATARALRAVWRNRRRQEIQSRRERLAAHFREAAAAAKQTKPGAVHIGGPLHGKKVYECYQIAAEMLGSRVAEEFYAREKKNCEGD